MCNADMTRISLDAPSMLHILMLIMMKLTIEISSEAKYCITYFSAFYSLTLGFLPAYKTATHKVSHSFDNLRHFI